MHFSLENMRRWQWRWKMEETDATTAAGNGRRWSRGAAPLKTIVKSRKWARVIRRPRKVLITVGTYTRIKFDEKDQSSLLNQPPLADSTGCPTRVFFITGARRFCRGFPKRASIKRWTGDGHRTITDRWYLTGLHLGQKSAVPEGGKWTGPDDSYIISLRPRVAIGCAAQSSVALRWDTTLLAKRPRRSQRAPPLSITSLRPIEYAAASTGCNVRPSETLCPPPVVVVNNPQPRAPATDQSRLIDNWISLLSLSRTEVLARFYHTLVVGVSFTDSFRGRVWRPGVASGSHLSSRGPCLAPAPTNGKRAAHQTRVAEDARGGSASGPMTTPIRPRQWHRSRNCPDFQPPIPANVSDPAVLPLGPQPFPKSCA